MESRATLYAKAGMCIKRYSKRDVGKPWVEIAEEIESECEHNKMNLIAVVGATILYLR